MDILLIILLVLLFWVVFRYRNALSAVFQLRKNYKKAQRNAQEEAERYEKVRRHTHPKQTSVEMIDDAALDLDGGEYVDYEEVHDHK